MNSISVPRQYAHAIVSDSVACRSCGYNLRGLEVRSRCPECGAGIWESVQKALDPEGTRLPALRNPRGVGDGLLWITSCGLIALSVTSARSVAQWLDRMSASPIPYYTDFTPQWLIIVSGVIAVIALYGVYKLAPPRHVESSGAVWRDIWLLAGGIFSWAMLAFASGWVILQDRSPQMLQLLAIAMGAAAIVSFIGMHGVLGIIGQRSREYRNSHHGRQSIHAINFAIVGTMIGLAIHLFASSRYETWGTVVYTTSQIMFVIGVAYLVINTWWIRRSLRKPPPTLDELLLPPLPDDTTVIHPAPDQEPFEVKAKGE